LHAALFFTENGGGKMVACNDDFVRVVFMHRKGDEKIDEIKEQILLRGAWNLVRVRLNELTRCWTFRYPFDHRSVLSKAELYAKYKMLLSKPCAERFVCLGKYFWAESGRWAALAGRQQY
jgi:hypothetical protein